MEFIGHACALYPDDGYLQGTAAELVARVQVRALPPCPTAMKKLRIVRLGFGTS